MSRKKMTVQEAGERMYQLMTEHERFLKKNEWLKDPEIPQETRVEMCEAYVKMMRESREAMKVIRDAKEIKMTPEDRKGVEDFIKDVEDCIRKNERELERVKYPPLEMKIPKKLAKQILGDKKMGSFPVEVEKDKEGNMVLRILLD